MAWTSWPPGAQSAPGRCPASYSSRLRSGAQTYSGWGERLVLAGSLAAFSGLLFVMALGLPFELLPVLR